MPAQRQSLMRTRLSLLAALATLVLAGAACGDDGSDDDARDPGETRSTPSPSRPLCPAASSRRPGRHAQPGHRDGHRQAPGAELCLGPIAESYPPQCGGPALVGWDWADHEDTFEQQGDVRWGTYLVTGAWDGTSMTASEAIPGALYDPAMPRRDTHPARRHGVLEHGAGGDRRAAARPLPGYVGAYGGEGTDGHVLADVFYDDGSLQEWADTTYGDHVVIVTSALVDAR